MVNAFVAGALMMGQAVAACFFFRFYRETRDRLFLFFGAAFSIFAVSRLAITLAAAPDEVRPAFYVLRLLGFLAILAGIADKNRAERRRGSPVVPAARAP